MSSTQTPAEWNALITKNIETATQNIIWLTEAHKRSEEQLAFFKEDTRRFREATELWRQEREAAEKAAKEERAAAEKERDAEWKKYEKRLKDNEDHWGILVESLVDNQIVPLLQARNIPVTDTYQRRRDRSPMRRFEFDIIAVNGKIVVIIEVKTTLRTDDVVEFLEKLEKIDELVPEFKDKKVFGAVAYIRDAGAAAALAEKRGLFTILATGSGAKITNAAEFEPVDF